MLSQRSGPRNSYSTYITPPMDALMRIALPTAMLGLLWCLLGTLTLRVASRWIARREIGVGQAFIVVMLASVLDALLIVPSGIILAQNTQSLAVAWSAMALLAPLGFALLAAGLRRGLRFALQESVSMAGVVTAMALVMAAVAGPSFWGYLTRPVEITSMRVELGPPRSGHAAPQ